MAMFLESMAVVISDFTAILLLGASGQIPFNEMPAMDAKFDDILSKMASVPVMAKFLRESLTFLTTQLMVTPDELTVMNNLCNAIEEQITALTALQPFAVGYITSLESTRRLNARVGKSSQHGVPRGSQELFKAASHCLKVSKALKVAVEVSRPAQTNDEDSGIFAKVKSVLSLGAGPEGCEKLTFPYMRCQLEQRFKAERFSLIGCDKNKIDAAIFPVYVLQNSTNTATSNTTNSSAAESRMSAKGLVLFCGPNAGFYEGLCQSDFNASWLGMYLRMGYDVCMFNYRGYGLSTGNPNPHSIKQDAVQVYTHLQRTRRPNKIIIHGESIGGMVACHLARTVPVDCLVCDRTFATLDATAARLMGRWAGLGLKYCTLWSTNVVRDYLAATCPKIVLQDPDDEIIANLASLKNGIAMRLILGDMSWRIVSEPWEYGYAQHLHVEMPFKDQEQSMIEEANDVTKRLTEPFIAHFHACLSEIARRASQTQLKEQQRRRPRSALAPVNASTPRRVTHRPGSTDEKRARGGGSSSNAQSSSNNGDNAQSPMSAEDGYSSSHGSRPASRHESKDFTFSSDTEGGGGDSDGEDAGKKLIHEVMGLASSSNDIWRDVGEESDAGQGDEESQSQGQGQAQGAPSSRKEWLEQFCATPLRDPAPGAITSNANSGRTGSSASSVSPQLKAWAAVGRINGGSGQLLGQALRGGIESVRAWICALLVWTPQAAADASLPAGCTTISGAIKDLNLLIEELHVQEFQHDRAVLFLRNALLCLDKRLDAQVFHKPSLQVQQRGAASFHTSSSERVERTDESYGGRYCCGSDAHMESGHAGSSAPVGFADAALGTLTTNAGRCLDVTRNYLSSNPYASIDMCSDLDCSRRSDGSSSASPSSDNSLTTSSTAPAAQASQCACNITYAQELVGLGGSSNAPPAHHLPYVGNLIALHSGHNGWPAATALASLNDFFVASTVA
eukprot:CAMPEP_0184979772 /NCGR_PEP_ID=MMETSP1098-20130426/9913_1 /TAXON_ID=89044 /ORGANISM="Spumella elongata, Strain CCAP 955/1" /LENGTH=960 /DNA_ID=CAMNT_0027503105 /DNA_START=470 /DNA_END=3352 /DNA_ORIENTATION=-